MIYLIGGTHDSRKVCQWLNDQGLDYFMSVATQLGLTTYQDTAKRLMVARLSESDMDDLVQAEGVDWIIDASHPHAALVSQTAIRVSQKNGIRYTRWLREEVQCDLSQTVVCADFEEAYERAAKEEGQVLVTGSKELAKALSYIPRERLVARIVPNGESIAICEALGLDSGQIIGIKGPFSNEMNQLIFKEWQIRHLIFKESGEGSGFEEKIDAALACQVTPYVVKMPRIEYPETARDCNELEGILNDFK